MATKRKKRMQWKRKQGEGKEKWRPKQENERACSKVLAYCCVIRTALRVSDEQCELCIWGLEVASIKRLREIHFRKARTPILETTSPAAYISAHTEHCHESWPTADDQRVTSILRGGETLLEKDFTSSTRAPKFLPLVESAMLNSKLITFIVAVMVPLRTAMITKHRVHCAHFIA